MYKKVSTDLNFVGREAEVLDFWKEQNVFEESVKQREGAPSYTFYDGLRPRMGVLILVMC